VDQEHVLSAALTDEAVDVERDRFLEAAVERVVAAGICTRDIAAAGGPSVSTAQMGDAVMRELADAADR
jgi:hypothetical protein